LVWLVLQGCMALPVSLHSPVSQAAFVEVFGGSLPVMMASILAFVVSQWLDVWVFDQCQKRLGRYGLWLRGTGSTVISQALDTAVFVSIAFGGQLPWPVLSQLWLGNYVVKVFLAVLGTPLLYWLRQLHRLP
jgi:queuosine precursor transporter